MIEGSGSGAGSVSLTNRAGFGSGRPENIWIPRIWIRNTAYKRRTIWLIEEKTMQNLFVLKVTWKVKGIAYQWFARRPWPGRHQQLRRSRRWHFWRESRGRRSWFSYTPHPGHRVLDRCNIWKYVNIVIVCLKACYPWPCRCMSKEVPSSKIRVSNNQCA